MKYGEGRIAREAIKKMRTLVRPVTEKGQLPELAPGMVSVLIPQEIARVDRQGGSLTFVILTVNTFKEVKNRFGEEASEHFINDSAKLVKSALRPYDAIARYGEDHFIVVLPGANEIQATRAVARVLDKIEQWNGHSDHYAISFNYGLVPYAKGVTTPDVIRLATKQLHQQDLRASARARSLSKAAGAAG